MNLPLAAAEPWPGLHTTPQPGALGGRKIVVTRAQAQATGLSEMIRAAGGVPVGFPTIEVEPLVDNADLDRALAALPGFDLAVFVSANAVAFVLARLAVAWPAAVQAAATGPGTAAALAARGVAGVIAPPAQFDSEGLLAELRRRNLSPKRVLIFKGEGGRAWLADALRAQGAQVMRVDCYRRRRAGADPRIVGRLAEARELAGVVVSSSEGGEYLMALLGEPASRWLDGVPMFVPHPRIAKALRAHGLSRIVLTGGGDAGIVAGIAAHFAAGKQ